MAVQFDATANYGGAVEQSSFSFSHTCSSDATILVMQTGEEATSATYDGQSMTLLSNYHPTSGTFAGNCPYVLVWYLLNPPTGTKSVVVNKNTGVEEAAITTSYKGVSGISIGESSASIGGQTVTWESTVSLGSTDWGVAFFAGSNNTGRTLNAYTNSTARISNIYVNRIMTIMDTDGVESPGWYSLWAQWSSSSGFVTVTTVSLQVIPLSITKSETIPVFDYLAKTPNRFLTETISLIETMAKVPSRLLNEAISLLDTLDNIKGTWYQVAYTETIALTDSIVNSFVFFITAVENLTITDAVLDFAKKLRGLLRGKNNNTNIKTGVRRT